MAQGLCRNALRRVVLNYIDQTFFWSLEIDGTGKEYGPEAATIVAFEFYLAAEGLILSRTILYLADGFGSRL